MIVGKTIRAILYLPLLAVYSSMHAQMPDTIAGEYYLQGVMEVASGFKLNEDSSFAFFFSYGAVDRYGSGRWTRQADRVIFNSFVHHDHDFSLLAGRTTTDHFITIKISDKNSPLLQFVYCSLNTGDTILRAKTDAKGVVRFPVKKVQSIVLQFEFCPEKSSEFNLQNSTDNYFEFRFEPWMAEVNFSEYSLIRTKDGLKGHHPLLDDKEYLFVKQ